MPRANRNVGVFVFLTHREEVVLVKKNYGDRKWCLPGGAVEQGESLRAALEREVLEETGVSLKRKKLGYVGVCYSLPGYSIAFLFEGSVSGKTRFTFNRTEISDARSFRMASLGSKVTPITALKIRYYRGKRRAGLIQYEG